MQRLYSWAKIHKWGLLVGTSVTLATVGLYLLDTFEPLSLRLLDYKFRNFNRFVADESIVMIDINDYAIERVHSWPWPRQYHSDLIHTLSELGARAVLMDIVFSEPTGGRLDDPRLDPDRDVDPAEIVGKIDETNFVFDDDELTEALHDVGNVYLAMFARLYHPQFSPDELRTRGQEILDLNPEISFTAFDRELDHTFSAFAEHASSGGRRALRFEPSEVFDAFRIEHLLQQSFQLEKQAVAGRLGLAEAFVEEHFAAAKRLVARRLVRSYLGKHSEADFENVYEHIMPDTDFHVFTSDREDLKRAFRAISAERAVVDRAITVHESLRGRIPYAADLTLPVEKFTEVAEVGLVSFETDTVDDVMRRVPLVVNVRGHLLKHLGLALACHVLGIDERTIRLEDGKYLTMATPSGSQRWRIPLDRNGRTLINWHIDVDRPEWTHSFAHIPVGRIMLISRLRRAIRDEEGLYGYEMQEFVRFSATQSELAAYQKLVRAGSKLRQGTQTPETLAQLEHVDQQVERIQQKSIEYVVKDFAPQVQEFVDSGGKLSEDNAQDLQALRALKLAAKYAKDPGGERWKRGIAAKRERIAELKDQLGECIKGKICLIGYTAAAVADTVNSPVFGEMPGVLAHANVINSMLTDRFPRIEPPWVNVLLILAGGLGITVVTTWRSPWVSLLCVLLMIAFLFAVGVAAFVMWTSHVKLTGALIGVLVAWALVTLYRQLTEERQKRAFSKSLAQYTSPAIAERLATQLSQKAGRLDLAPVPRVVTCFFSDLKGFTSISERLGASRTREVLNPYLEAMSQVLIEDSAMINKFMGDGIFAFFNPPILPLENHRVAACEAALRSFDALERLKDEIGHGELEQEVRALSMRIGLNSGEVFVGDYGSSNKLDYTCIGDTVNLAARLEPACKVFGIQCLISETTFKGTLDRFVVRHLGGLQVVGKKEVVQVFELIGRRGEVNGEQEAYADLFGETVTKFQQRDWEGTLGLLDQCRRKRPDDIAIDLLADNVRRYQQTPPPDDWNQAIELTSK